MTYHITQRERALLLRSESPRGGGAQAHLYRLKCCMQATEDGYVVDVPDELDQCLGRMLQTMGADDGGWQARIPFAMRNRWMRRHDPAPAELF